MEGVLFSDLFQGCAKNRSAIARRIVEKFHLTWLHEPKAGRYSSACDFYVPHHLIGRVVEILSNKHVVHKKGQIYCFSPQCKLNGRGVFKIGRSNDWVTRKNKYTGMNQPHVIYFVLSVANQRESEDKLIEHCKKNYEQIPWSSEWFYLPKTQFDVDSLRKLIEN